MISRLKLKRAVSSTVDAPAKKSRLPMETPHPTLESSALTFKLPSSVGIYETPREFSPLPVVSSSRRLKENRAKPPAKTYGKYGKNLSSKSSKASVLESPFDSSPEKPTGRGLMLGGELYTDRPETSKFSKLTLGGPLSTLPLPSLASAPSSPRHHVSPRRPSFDAPHTHITFDIFSPARDIDFNRPPSQLSLYDYNACAFDADLPGLVQSTPRNATIGYDTESDDDDDDSKLGCFAGMDTGYETPDMDDEWTSDSLISPLTKAKSQVNDIEMHPPPESQVLEDLFDSLILMPSSPLRSRSLDSGLKDKDSILDSSTASEDQDTSVLAPALPITRTRSGTVVGRARSETIKSSTGTGPALVLGSAMRAPPTRTRSGTIVQGVQGRSRSGSIRTQPPTGTTGRARSGSIVVPPAAATAGRARSGSIVAPPPSAIVTGRTRSGSIVAPQPLPTKSNGSMGPPPPPTAGRTRSGSVVAPPGRSRSGSVLGPLPSGGRNRSSSILDAPPLLVRARSGSIVGPTKTGRVPQSSMAEVDEQSPDELDCILQQEPNPNIFVKKAIKPRNVAKGVKEKLIEKARMKALKRCQAADVDEGEIGDDELLLRD